MGMQYTIRAAAQLSGLSAHTIRAWERRHHVLSPARTETNRRVYEASDIERLKLLRGVVAAGHGISLIAQLSTEDLQSLMASPRPLGPLPPAESPNDSSSAAYLVACESAMDRMDADSLEQTLMRAAAILGLRELLESVIVPLVESISVRWVAGTSTIAQEHMTSAVLRTYLESVRSTMRSPIHAPRLLVTTPRNQVHEIGALIVSMFAAMQGWNVTYLGPNLPAEEIANATRQCAAHAVGLSLVFPDDDPTMAYELKLLRHTLGPAVPILVGGRAASNYSASIAAIGAQNVQTLSGLRESLDQIRRGAA